MNINRTENGEQQAVLEWCELNSGRYPELKLLYHIPNEGKRSKSNGALLKSIGLKKGVPDMCLPVSRGGFHALYIELKKDKNAKTSAEQLEWYRELNAVGNLCFIAYGADDAIRILKSYVSWEAEQ